MFKCKSFRMSTKRGFYVQGIVAYLAMYGAETWNMGAAERKRLNVDVLRYLRSMCKATLMNQMKNEELHRRTGIVR